MKKYIVNLGGARSGTTAMHAYFDNCDLVNTPAKVKEIKSFFNEDLTIEQYESNFSGNSNFFFESSPPYMHAGTEKFKEVLSNIKSVLGDDAILVFNVRPLLDRSFSHYWHDINKHYSIYGRAWKIRDKNSPERYAATYNHSFPYALRKNSEKLMPDVAGMISMAIDYFSKEKVFVILQNELEYGIEKITSSLGIPFVKSDMVRISSVRSPIFIESGFHDLEVEQASFKIKIPEGMLLRVGYDELELLDEKEYDISSIYSSYKSWSSSVSFDKIDTIFSPYLNDQRDKLLSLPSEIFHKKSEISIVEYLLGVKNLNVKSQILKISDFESLNLIV